MKKYDQEIFNDFIMGAGAVVYTSAAFNLLLASADQISLQAITDQVTTTGSIAGELEHSGDGRNWTSVSGTPELSVATTAGATTGAFASFTGSSRVVNNFVRLKLTMSTSTAAHVVVRAVGRE